MEPLKLLPIDRDVLRSVLENDESDWPADWEFYDHEDSDQDSTFCSAIRRADEWLSQNPVNGDRDSLDITLVADLDGTVEGYEFLYDTRIGEHTLSLASRYSEWRGVRGDSDGIEGVIDFLVAAIWRINWAIEEANAWFTARAAA